MRNRDSFPGRGRVPSAHSSIYTSSWSPRAS